MKKVVLLSLNLLWATFVAAQVVNIPDANFKNALVSKTSINTNGDGEIQVSEAESYTGQIDVNSKSISDLTGIEAFVKLTSLNCSGNSLSTLNVSKNVALLDLNCNLNNLSSLDISKNIDLVNLSCTANKLSALDISKNIKLLTLDCTENVIQTLNVSKNTVLRGLYCAHNKLQTLDMNKNIALVELMCGNNVLTNLTVKNGNNKKLTLFIATVNPFLKCIEVDNPNASHTNWTKDPTASYSSNCMIPTKDISSEGFLQLYPNPSTESFAFSNLNEAPLSVAIYDLHGKLVQHYPTPASNYDISTLCNGLYIVKAQFATGEAIAKLLKGE